jgi:putative SOS response-associated peptidase YedK
MCGRFSLYASQEVLLDAFGLALIPDDYRPRYNIAPTQQILMVTGEAPREARWARWGLVPSWAKEQTMGNRLINARAETVAEKPSFRTAFRRRRCLVLTSGFYEWKASVGPRGGKGSKVPHLLGLPQGQPFAFAGLWEQWRGADGPPLITCTIITMDARPPVRAIHHRMPVMVRPGQGAQWLADEPPAQTLARFQEQPIEKELEIHEVSTLVNSATNDQPECLVPLPRQQSLLDEES